MFFVLAKLGTALVLVLVLFVILNQRAWVENKLDKPGVPWLGLFWLVFRFLPFLGVYVWLGYEPQSDVKDYYYPIGMGAGAGKILYRDVYCPYAPLFGYYLVLPLKLWHSSRVIVLTMTLVELLAVWLTYRQRWTDEVRAKRVFRVLFYYLLPIPFIFSVLSGQEDVGLWIFALLTGQATVARRSYQAGLWFVLGLLSTKVIFVLLFIPFIFLVQHKIRFLAGCLTLGLPTLAFLLWKTGFRFITQPLDEGTYLKAPNLRSLLAPFFGEQINTFVHIESYIGLGITALVAIGILLTMRITIQLRTIALFYIMLFSLTTVLQHNAISTYAYLFMLPFVFSMLNFEKRWTCYGLILFNAAAAVHPSFWWRIGQPFYYSFSQLIKPIYLTDYIMEVFLVGGFAYITIRAARLLRTRAV